MIISDEPKIFEILEKYEQNADEEELRENIITLLRPKRKLFFPLNFFLLRNLLLIYQNS